MKTEALMFLPQFFTILTRCGLVMPYGNINLGRSWLRCCLMEPSHYLNQYNGVRQSDRETHPSPGNYTTTSDTWIQVSTNKCLPGYAWPHSNNCHCDIIMGQLWLWLSSRHYKLVGFGKPSAFPHQLLGAVGLNKDLSREKQQNVAGSCAGYRMIMRHCLCGVPSRKERNGRPVTPARAPTANHANVILFVDFHYLNQCWLIINGVLWHSPESNLARSAHELPLDYNLKSSVFKLIWRLDILSISCNIVLMWVPQDLTGD